MGYDAFRRAVEARDHVGMVEALAPDVVLDSPITFKPFRGRETVSLLFGVLLATFEDFRYTDELAGDGVHALIFEARIGDRQVQGLDLIRADANERIGEFTVMVRPASGLMALAERMGPALQAAGV